MKIRHNTQKTIQRGTKNVFQLMRERRAARPAFKGKAKKAANVPDRIAAE